MYNPFQPTNIAAYRIRLREEDEAESLRQRQRRLTEEALLATASQSFSPDEMHRQRVEVSASLGIKAAKEYLDDDADLQNKIKKHEGTDKASKMSRLLGRMEGSAVDGSVRTVEGLKFTTAGLAAGGHKITATDSSTSQPKAAPFRGKPSSTLLLTGWCSPEGALSSSEWSDIDQFTTPLSHSLKLFARHVQQSSGTYGVVRNGRLGCADGQWRLLLRFDSVSSAFRAAEALNGKSTAELWERIRGNSTSSAPFQYDEGRSQVAFYNTSKYDTGQFTESV